MTPHPYYQDEADAMTCDDDEMPYVAPEDENLIILDGARHPYEWQPTISAAWHADAALGSREPSRLDVLTAFIVGYNKGAADQKLRDTHPATPLPDERPQP